MKLNELILSEELHLQKLHDLVEKSIEEEQLISAYTSTQAFFDPYPFILLNLVLSCLAALQAPVIMMSQNRKENKDRRRARSDYLINLKAEMEVRSLQNKVDLLITDQMKSLFAIQKTQLELLSKIESRLNKTD